MKNVDTVNHLYFYVNGMLLMEYRYNAMGDTTDVLQYFYDANGRPHAMAYNGTVYLYVTNLQSDIVALLGMDGTISGYEYDPYGNVIAYYGDIAAINPLRYRGYYYDNETGLYYLQSRYYDPVVGRFINADSYASTGQGILGYNVFAYCQNNVVNYVDSTGCAAVGIFNGGIDRVLGGGSGSGAEIASAVITAGVITEISETADDLLDSFSRSMQEKLLKAKHREYRSETEVHHIAAKMSYKAKEAQAILIELFPDGVENPINKVQLKTSVHRRAHTNVYYAITNSLVAQAYNSSNGNKDLVVKR